MKGNPNQHETAVSVARELAFDEEETFIQAVKRAASSPHARTARSRREKLMYGKEVVFKPSV
jgi:hypothetical protein